MRTQIDLQRLREEIRGMSRHGELYKALKEELSALGYWQNRGRGKPSARHFYRQSDEWD